MNNQFISAFIKKIPSFQHNLIKMLKIAIQLCNQTKYFDFLAPLFLRLYLVPIFWMAGITKFSNFSNTVDWFGNSDWGLDLPFPFLLVFLVASIELFGAIFLLFGLGVRLISIPLMIIMVVAAVTVHLKHGWLVIATGSGIFATDRTIEAIERLNKAKDILKQYGNYDWLTEQGGFVVLNNGIEFSVTYFVMLLTLFFLGAGRYLSVDYWLQHKFMQSNLTTTPK
jgi:uncharacterized membrane protein YphA (DoxX/SURF4 family)